MKTNCKTCGDKFTEDNKSYFTMKRKGVKDYHGFRTKCKSCLNIEAKTRRYDLTHEEVVELTSKKECDLCGVHIKNSKEKHIDHCHETGKVRGLLCKECNVGLGYIEKHLDDLPNILKYINHEKINTIYINSL